MFSDTPAQPALGRDRGQPARRRQGRPQHATGPNSETLDWARLDLRDLPGKQAQIQLVDTQHRRLGPPPGRPLRRSPTQPALSVVAARHWIDYGKDYYAAVTWNDAPDGKRRS